MFPTRNTFRRLSRRVGFWMQGIDDRRSCLIYSIYDMISTPIRKILKLWTSGSQKGVVNLLPKNSLVKCSFMKSVLEKQTLSFWAGGSSRDISIIMSLPTEFTKKRWDTTISWIWDSSVTIWGSFAWRWWSWRSSLNWICWDKSVLSWFWKYAVSESQFMIFLQLEDKIDSSHQERRTTERGAAASVKAKTDKEEGGGLSSVDHQRMTLSTSFSFVQICSTKKWTITRSWVLENRLKSIGFYSYASGPIQERQESVLQGKSANQHALTSRKGQCSRDRVRLITLSWIHSLSNWTETESVEMRIAVLTFWWTDPDNGGKQHPSSPKTDASVDVVKSMSITHENRAYSKRLSQKISRIHDIVFHRNLDNLLCSSWRRDSLDRNWLNRGKLTDTLNRYYMLMQISIVESPAAHQSYISEGLFGRDSQDRICFSLRKSTGRTCASSTHRSVIFDNPCDMNLKKKQTLSLKAAHRDAQNKGICFFFVLSDDFFPRVVRWYTPVYEKILVSNPRTQDTVSTVEYLHRWAFHVWRLRERRPVNKTRSWLFEQTAVWSSWIECLKTQVRNLKTFLYFNLVNDSPSTLQLKNSWM